MVCDEMVAVEWIKDRWLTWRTGKPKHQRDYEAWYYATVNHRASTAEQMFSNFEHVIQVDPDKFLTVHMFTQLKEEVLQYRYPQRSLGDNMVYSILRGEQMPDGLFHITDFGVEDRVYVATNNSEDAMILALKYR